MCLIALRCESARPQSRSKMFKVKEIFNFFAKRVFSIFQDSAIILSEKNFSDFQINLSPDIAMRSQRQKLPLLVIREGRLSLFGSHGKGTEPRVSHCIATRECQTPVEVKSFQSQKMFNFFSKRVFPMFQDAGIILSKKNFPTFRPI